MTASPQVIVDGTLYQRGQDAGIASRASAFITDIIFLVAVFYGAFGFVALVWGPINLRRPSFPEVSDLTFMISFGIWMYFYWWLCWTLWAKTLGKTLIGLRVVTKTGDRVRWFRALVRALAYTVSFAFIFLGFIWIALGRRRRGWHDYIAGTRVVYDWNARPAAIWRARHGQEPV